MISLTKQRGTAIVIALFVVAVATIAATVMIEQLRTDIRRTELIINTNRAYLYAQGSVFWAIDQLNNNWKKQKPNQLIDRIPIKSPVDNQNGIVLTSVIYDAQSYFNINNLSDDPKESNNFVRVIQTVAPEIEIEKAEKMARAVIDWISPTNRNMEFDEFYLKSTPSYKAPHRPMVSISELRLVKDITPDLYTKLLPYVIALPTKTMINVNNASLPVLVTLGPTLTVNTAKAIEQARAKEPFANLQNFLNLDIIKNNAVDNNKVTISSSYFLVETNVKFVKVNLTLYTLLERITKNSEPQTTILWQSIGTL